MTADRTYEVNDESEVKAIYIPMEVANMDSIKPRCSGAMYKTLDYLSPDGHFETAWSEQDSFDNEWPFWVEEIDGFEHLMV
jgi:hypothetical protein